MTARLSEAELLEWVPTRFDDITDLLAAPEPSKGALSKESRELVVEIPETTGDSSALVSEFLSEVPLPSSRVLWHRPDITLPRRRGRSLRRSAQSVSLPRKRR